MISAEALKYLQGMGAEQPGPNTPWSQMLGQNFSSQPPAEEPTRSPVTSYADMAMPPMTQPELPAPPMALPDMGGESGGFSQSSVSMSPEMLALYREQMKETKSSIGEQTGYLDKLKAYGDRVRNAEQKPDYSALMMLSDAWGGTKFQNQYKKPTTQEERDAQANVVDNQIANQLGNISKEKLSMLKTQSEGLMQSQRYKEAGDSKMSDQDERDRQALMKALDTEKSSGRFTPIGKAQSNLYQAERIQALLDQYKADPNKMPLTGPASLSEIAIGLNSLLSATGGSEESRKSLIPSSVRGKYSTFEQFVMNEPRGANMAEFVHNAADTLDREKKTNAKQISDYRGKLENAWGLGRFNQRHPDQFKKMIDFYSQAPAEAPAMPAASPASPASNVDAEREAIYQQFPHVRPKK